MKITYEHIVPFPKDKVLEIYVNDDFYVGMQKNAGAISVDLLETSDLPEGGRARKARITAPSRVPAALRKSDTDEYVDDCKVDVSAARMFYRITPNMFADQFKLSGSLDFIDQDDSTKLVFTTEIEIRIPLLGKKLEKQSLAETEKEVLAQVSFLKDWAGK